MNTEQRNHIQQNYVELVRNIECTEEFMSFFIPMKILTLETIELIAKQDIESRKARKFMEIVQKKGEFAFDVWYAALKHTHQYPAADILKPSLAPSRGVPAEAEDSEGEVEDVEAVHQRPQQNETNAQPTTETSGRREEVDRAPTPRPEDDDSDLSDSLDYFDESTDMLDYINIRVVPCRKQRIRDLYFKDDRVYKMSSPKRGRCLVINNRYFKKPTSSDQAELSERKGSEMDVKNIVGVFRALKFDVDNSKNDVSSQEMLKAVRDETENAEHFQYGMFVLVIMTHGTETHLYGADGRSVQRSEIFDLLSAYKFSGMAGKPKMVLLQACSGERKDMMGGFKSDSRSYKEDALPPLPPDPEPSPNSATPGEYLSSDDLFIMRASFLSYISTRHERQGTWFIRAVVEALYKHSCHRDIQTLFEKQVKKKVREKSIKANRQYGYTSGQQPTLECFPTKDRKLYLFPDYNP